MSAESAHPADVASGATRRERIAADRARPAWSARLRVHPLPLAVLIVGLAATGVLTWASRTAFDDNESRLLNIKAKETIQLLSAATSAVQTPLEAASAVAGVTGGNPGSFQQAISPFVGSRGQFVSASLWRLSDIGAGPIVAVGAPPALTEVPGRAEQFLSNSAHKSSLSVANLLQGATPRIGYAFHSANQSDFAVYAESAAPANRRAAIAQNSAFSDIHYALYLGTPLTSSNLLATDLNSLPPTGRRQTVSVPFGDSSFTLVVTPRGTLGGNLLEYLALIVAILGSVLAIVAAVVSEFLQRRRQRAESLAAALDQAANETAALYAHERAIASRLQRALLPERLPAVRGLDATSSYTSGTFGLEVGGDWYDLIPLGDHKAFLIVGDVSGRGVEAATIMARLRFGALAYAQQGDPPEVVLTKLSEQVANDQTNHFATAVCALVDVRGHRLTLANAGHPPPLLVSDTVGFVDSAIGTPVGVENGSYEPVSVTVPTRATLLAFTDGLVERRGETIDRGLQRLSTAVLRHRGETLEDLVHDVVSEITSGGIQDDAAILAVRWQT